MRAGWAAEVSQLIQRGFSPDAKPFQFIGYSELRHLIEAEGNPEEALPAIQRATRRFAKRQITWFRKEPAVHWLAGFGDSPDIASAALKLIEARE